MTEKKMLGNLGESFAASYLKMKGYRILDRNYCCSGGEIDIVAEKEKELFFVEVKTRTNEVFGDPSQSVTGEKQRRLRKAASHYLHHKRGSHDFFSFQVIEVGIQQIRDAF